MLLLGLAVSAVPVLYSIFLIPPSKLCGPFRGLPSIWAQIPEAISGLPQSSQNVLFFLGTQAFAVPLLLISSILLAYTVALAHSYGRVISALRRQMETVSRAGPGARAPAAGRPSRPPRPSRPQEAQNKTFLAQRAVALSAARAARTPGPP